MSEKKYDYLIVGAGLFGSVCAYELTKRGYKCLVVEKRNHVGGNIYTENNSGINIHKYGAHIFHTSNKDVWDYINKFALFNNFINSPIANYKGEMYHLPFNMNTFHELWPEVNTPEEAEEKINKDKEQFDVQEPKNLKEQAIKLVGPTIFHKLIEGYTAKQWGRKCEELPPFIIKRIPVRFTYNNNYFNDTYQGIPIGGYTQIVNKMLDGANVILGCDFNSSREKFMSMAKMVIYTGMIDEFFNYSYGPLEYRSLVFKEEKINASDFQGNAVVNYTDFDTPFTRIIEHKHFEFNKSDVTIISREYPKKWERGDEPYYPVNNEKNTLIYNKYLELSKSLDNVVFGGRLGLYKYLDMDKVILEALNLIENLMNNHE